MRRPTSCVACRARRRKCNIALGAESCVYCLDRGLICVKEPPSGGYYHQHRLQTSNNLRASNRYESSSAIGCDSRLPPLHLRKSLVQLYFDYIHNQFHTLFHPPTFLERVVEDRVPHVLLYSMCALSARFSNDSSFFQINPKARGAVFLESAVKALDIRDVSLITVQACILIGAAYIADGDDTAESIYYSIASRVAQLLDVPNLPVSCLLEHEINVRVWSSLCMVDVWSSTNVKLPKVMPSIDLPLPMDEQAYLALRYGNDDTGLDFLEFPSPLISEMIKLNRILLAINEFNEACVKDQPSGLILEHAIHGLSRRLDDWYEALPASMRDTRENFAMHASHGLGRTFAAVYLGYYHFGQLLFYQFLHTASYSSTPSAALYAEKCKEHAGNLCEMIYRAFATPNSEVLYTMVAHVLVIASTVQIHTLLFSEDDSQINLARSRLERNFEVLLHLRPFWSTLDGAMKRLRAFHDTCSKSMDTSFVLDRWMLKFLVEFAKPIEEKGFEEQTSPSAYWTLDGIAPLRN